MRVLYFWILAFSLGCFYSCTDFLEEKSDQSLTIPDNLRDLQAIMDDEDRMIMSQPAAGDIAADYYFLKEEDWSSRTIDTRDTYLWDGGAQNYQDWTSAYNRIFYTNVALDEIDLARKGNMTERDREEIKGSAYFFRGWTYLMLAQLFCPYYAIGMDDSEYGLPLKIHADINEPIVRSSLVETYDQIRKDLINAALLLPEWSGIATRPSKSAAYGALARLNLIIGDYQQSSNYADSCLAINDQLIDYKLIDPSSATPFEILNQEVIFHAVINGNSGVHQQSLAYVDSTLIDTYLPGDLRKELFFVGDNTGHYRFKGGYHGSTTALFGGLALDEIYLISAESRTRMGFLDQAKEIFHNFLKMRLEENSYVDLESVSQRDLLTMILKEREKQLLFRGGIRWSDLRRLNRDEKLAKTIQRRIGSELHELPPNDLRYTFLLPVEVIQISSVIQNPR